MSTNLRSIPRWWLFQSNPTYYDLTGAMAALKESTWAVTRFGREMKRGDRVFLWESGPAGGIRGLATITGPLRPRATTDTDAAFVLSPDKIPDGHEVPIRFDQAFPRGPGRQELSPHPVLSKMSHMNQPQPTNHRVGPKEATALVELLGHVPEGIPESVTRGRIVHAIRDIDAGMDLPFGPSKSYPLHFGLKTYASKAVIGRARERATGLGNLPNNFSGGLGNTKAAGFLVKRRFFVEEAANRSPADRTRLRWVLRMLLKGPIPRGQLRLYRLLMDAYPEPASVEHLKEQLGDGDPKIYGGLRSALANRINGLWGPDGPSPGLDLLVERTADGLGERPREALIRAIEALPELFDHLEAHDEPWLAAQGQAIEVNATAAVRAFLEEESDDDLEGTSVDFDTAFAEFIAQLPGATLGANGTVRVRSANEYWVELLPTEKTGRIALPTPLVREWLLASDAGLFAGVSNSQEMRKLVQVESEWANFHHGFDSKLRTLVDAWREFLAHGLSPSQSTKSGSATPQPLPAIHRRFSGALREAGLHFGTKARHDAFTRAFLTSVLTKRFVILTGLSGSGKSQIALRFGDFLGPGRSSIVPVRPDWTSPEALLGFPDLLRKKPDEDGVPWHTPPTLEFILKASESDELHLLILDEMNLAHVERYFADVLSGIESDAPCIPALIREGDQWMSHGGARMPLPKNLIIIGTVNVDETTYMFSPKVLDRANTLEFRVQTADLPDDLSELRAPGRLSAASPEDLAGLRAALSQPQRKSKGTKAELGVHLKALHAGLATAGFEFGHRVYFEAHRFADIHRAMGGGGVKESLDLQLMQKVLPRLHGSRRRVEGVLLELARYAFYGSVVDAAGFDPQAPPTDQTPVLPLSFDKLQRMLRRLAANQFVSFSE